MCNSELNSAFQRNVTSPITKVDYFSFRKVSQMIFLQISNAHVWERGL